MLTFFHNPFFNLVSSIFPIIPHFAFNTNTYVGNCLQIFKGKFVGITYLLLTTFIHTITPISHWSMRRIRNSSCFVSDILLSLPPLALVKTNGKPYNPRLVVLVFTWTFFKDILNQDIYIWTLLCTFLHISINFSACSINLNRYSTSI